jgi:hypothetical protein
VIIGVFLLAALSRTDGAEPLRLHVTPAASIAPGFVRVKASIEADSDNRYLEIVAVSQDFYRSSEVQIDGAQAPRLSEFRFNNLPAGDYEFTAILIGTKGPRARTSQSVRVLPIGGSGR